MPILRRKERATMVILVLALARIIPVYQQHHVEVASLAVEYSLINMVINMRLCYVFWTR